MFRTNLKIAWRNLIKDRQFTLLNVLGLSAGLACTLLIFLWVTDELNYDKFFANDDRIFKLFEKRSNGAGDFTYSEESSGRLASAAKHLVPEVEYAAAVAPPGWFPQKTLTANEKNIKASGQYAEKDYFNIFSIPLVDGDRDKLLEERSSIVLSDELALKLFGTTAGLTGKPVIFDHDTTFFVSGVFKKLPVNSSQQFDFVLSFDYFKTVSSWVWEWHSTGPLNYVLLKPGTDQKLFTRKVADVIKTSSDRSSTYVFPMKFSDVYLRNERNGNVQGSERIQFVKLFSLLAVFILVIGCINFMNLSTSKGARRFKEVGIKKVVGAERHQLIGQFLTESVMLSLIAMVFAVVIAVLLLPRFNQLTGKHIDFRLSWPMALSVLGIGLITGLFAGCYPALYISKFNPLTILKGKLQTSAAELFSRKGLVIFQFTLSTILIIAVLVIYQQVQFIQHADPGFKKDNLLRLSAEGTLSTRQDVFLDALRRIPGVSNVSATNHRMIGHNYATNALDWPGKPDNEQVLFEGFEVADRFTETMGMKIAEGRTFSREFGADSTKIILNEAAVKAMNLKNPVGQTIQLVRKDYQVIGVVKDFHFESMHSGIKPSYIVLVPHRGTIIASVQRENQRSTLAAVQHLYEQFNPGFPFTFNFLDEAYQQQYESEVRVSDLATYFAALAIIISCLGLFGLAAFTAQQRRKEIGVRKVVGASVADITVMLSRYFVKLVLISLIIAFPVSWWLMSGWLQDFAYRIDFSPLVFAGAGLTVLAITVLTVSYQSIKAALANPVKSLRSE